MLNYIYTMQYQNEFNNLTCNIEDLSSIRKLNENEVLEVIKKSRLCTSKEFGSFKNMIKFNKIILLDGTIIDISLEPNVNYGEFRALPLSPYAKDKLSKLSANRLASNQSKYIPCVVFSNNTKEFFICCIELNPNDFVSIHCYAPTKDVYYSDMVSDFPLDQNHYSRPNGIAQHNIQTLDEMRKELLK